jgi:hypothetical protein
MTSSVHNLYSSSNITRIMKSGRIRWAGHVAHIGRRRIHAELWLESHKEIDQQDDLGVGGRIIMKLISRDIGRDGMDWNDLAQDRDQRRALVNTVMNLRAP